MSRRLSLAAFLTFALFVTPLAADAKSKTTTDKTKAGHSSGRKTH